MFMTWWKSVKKEVNDTALNAYVIQIRRNIFHKKKFYFQIEEFEIVVSNEAASDLKEWDRSVKSSLPTTETIRSSEFWKLLRPLLKSKTS